MKRRWYDIGYQVDRLLVSSFIPPFIMSFFIALFVLIMQFLWRFIEEIIGKGVGIPFIMEMFFYKSISLFPLALPIAVLLASVMVLGNLAEKYELASFKSAGVPLTRVMLPLFVFCAGIGFFSFYCSNSIIPVANLKYASRLYDIRNKKPTLSIEPGVFNEDFMGYAIRVGKKHKDKQTIEDIMVYDDSQRNRGLMSVVTAKRGKMYIADSDGAFVMTLYDGYQYAEGDPQGRPGSLPFTISHFNEWTRRFDLSEFNLDRTEEDQWKSHHTMKSARQIAMEIDTLEEQIHLVKSGIHTNYNILMDPRKSQKDTNNQPQTNQPVSGASGLQSAPLESGQLIAPQGSNIMVSTKWLRSILDTMQTNRLHAVHEALTGDLWKEYVSQIATRMSIAHTTADRNARTLERLEANRRKHLYELHWKFSLAVACVVMLLTGGPMGTIVRKGGFGYPLLVSIFFFTFFIMSNISCKKLSDSGNLPPVLAAWLPVIVLGMISVFLTWKALNDSRMFDIEKIRGLLKRFRPVTQTQAS